MTDNLSLVDMLRTVSLFAGFSLQEYDKIASCARPCSLASGEVLINEGDSGESMYIVADGKFEVWKCDSTGSHVTIGFLVNGSYFGELALIDYLPRSASVEAISESRLYELQRADFLTLLHEDPVLGNKFYSNCLKETFSRFRNIISDFTFSQSHLRTQTAVLDEINSDLESAKNLQRYFINSDFLDATPVLAEGVRQSYLYNPCFDIGGDFINIKVLDDSHIGVIIADVAGHGITASLATGVIKSAFSIFFEICPDQPKELIAKMNRHIYNLMNNYFATCFYAYIDLTVKKIRMSKAGHPYPLLWRNGSQTFFTFQSRGIALGIRPEYDFGEIDISFEQGDKILFYTDGIVEQMNEAHEMYGDERMIELFRKLILGRETAILPRMFEDLKQFSDRKIFDDDITMLLLEF
jgi:serine phosphatase RsbU (regulator of sigma subunit)